MGIYDELGLCTVINASGTLTRLGGSRMAPETLAAMAEAAASFVHIDELQERAGAVLAEVTGAEAGYVVTGAAAGLSLGTAACVAGMDVAAMDRLPDTTGLKNEIVVQRGHRNAYDHAIRAVGVRMVEVGYLGYPGAGGTHPWQIAEAISERTAAVACPVMDTPGTVPLSQVCEIAHARGVPVIVDAAAELPPRANLHRYIAEGADLVVFSGGKAIAGPQASGILVGRADVIASVALQHQDMDVRPETWLRRGWLSTGRVGGVPHQGFGRSMKVGREEIIGLLVALRAFAAGSDEADLARWQSLLDPIECALDGLPGLQVTRQVPAHKPVPLLRINIDGECAGARAYAIVNALLTGDPAIAIDQSHAEHGRLTVNPMGITEDEAAAIARRLRQELERGDRVIG
jgi:L-seryl-tRNA(Ser) seleniumtransferase